MAEFHARLGEGLFVIYLIVLVIVWFMSRQDRKAPAWLMGIAHALLGLQVILGIILIAQDSDRIVWYHPVLGILAALSLGLMPVFRNRLGPRTGPIAALGVTTVVVFLAMLAATTA
jgi:hypothetical protein